MTNILLNGGLANELYIMGAETSTGKSAFMMDLAQNVAKQGVDVLYFILEMSKDEMIGRGISAISFKQYCKDPHNNRYTAGDILYWTYNSIWRSFSKLAYSQYEKYADAYFETYGKHLHFIEPGIQGITVKEIANTAALFKEETGKTPVVFVDYLQLIKADPDDRSQADRKSKLDNAVTTLKTLASQVGMPVFTLSSLSRGSYCGNVGTASFKESGDIEYTGGILVGWNWDGVTNQKNDADKKKEKSLSKKRGYRRMTLEVLKYRNGERDSVARFKYYPAYNVFEEDNDPVTDEE